MPDLNNENCFSKLLYVFQTDAILTHGFYGLTNLFWRLSGNTGGLLSAGFILLSPARCQLSAADRIFVST